MPIWHKNHMLDHLSLIERKYLLVSICWWRHKNKFLPWKIHCFWPNCHNIRCWKKRFNKEMTAFTLWFTPCKGQLLMIFLSIASAKLVNCLIVCYRFFTHVTVAPFVIDNFLEVVTLEIYKRDKFELVTCVKTM